MVRPNDKHIWTVLLTFNTYLEQIEIICGIWLHQVYLLQEDNRWDIKLCTYQYFGVFMMIDSDIRSRQFKLFETIVFPHPILIPLTSLNMITELENMNFRTWPWAYANRRISIKMGWLYFQIKKLHMHNKGNVDIVNC